ncbi:MAG: YfhO family protein, partial [Actinobacteria bacterium]|nr:YfhO family protein [Actinomycetota bacterium]
TRFREIDPTATRKGFESLAASVQGNFSSIKLGGSTVFFRDGAKAHVFIPDRVVAILGGWDGALAADRIPGLDLNKCAYSFSEQGSVVASAFSQDSFADSIVAAEPTVLDTVMPFVGSKGLVSVADAKGVNPENGFRVLSAGSAFYSSNPLFGGIRVGDRSLDYGLGSVQSMTNYEPTQDGWLERDRLAANLDMGIKPLPLTTVSKGLTLEQDFFRDGGKKVAAVRGQLQAKRNGTAKATARSIDLPCSAEHPYGVRFRIAGERSNGLCCKVLYYNSFGEYIGEQVLSEGLEDTFPLKTVEGHFTPVPSTAFCRFEVSAGADREYRSAWRLGNVEIFDLAGISKRSTVTVGATIEKKGKYNLMFRCLGLTPDGRVGFLIDGKKSAFVDTYSNPGRMGWLKACELKLDSGEHTVEISNLAGMNIMNALAVVSDEDLLAAEERLSRQVGDRDIACVFDLTAKRSRLSYTQGRVSRSDTLYCPATATLTPTFKGSPDFGKRGISLRINGTECDSSSLFPTGEPGWVAAPPISVPRGEVKVEVDYPISSLVNLPSGRSSTRGAEWSSVTEGLTLSVEPSKERGQMNLAGQVNPGEPIVALVARSKQFDINPKTKYSSFVKLDGQNMKGLQVALLMLDKDGRELGRAALTDEMNGTFNGSEVFREVETTHEAARYGAVEVICHPDAQGPTSWRLSGLFLNETSSTASPIDKIALVPQSWAQGSAGTTGKEEPPAGVKILKGSPTGYRVKVIDAKRPFMLVFSEQYAPDWELFIDGKKIKPVPVDTLLNGYPLKKKGTYEVSIRYRPQKWVNIGLVPSILTLIACFAFLIVKRRKRKKTEKEEGTL